MAPSPTTTPTATGVAGATSAPSATATHWTQATSTATTTPTVTSTATPSPTATPAGPVVVLNMRYFTYTLSGQTWLEIVGEVKNQSFATAENVEVRVDLLRDDLLVLATLPAEVFADHLGPMQTAPFRIVVEPPTDFDSARSQAPTWKWADAPPPPPLAAPTRTYQSADGVLCGQILNSMRTPIQRTRVVAVYRDTAGAVANVVDSGIGAASPYGLTLAPDATTPFCISLIGGLFPGEPTYTTLYQPAADPAPLPLPTSRVRVSAGPGHAEVYGEVTNTTPGPIVETQVIGTFYDGSGRVVVADWAWASQNADRILNPGVVAPFVLSLHGQTATGWTRYELQTTYRAASEPLPDGVTVENATFSVSLDYDTLTLRGTVVNAAGVSVGRPRLVATFYQQGFVYYVVVAELPDVAGLPPGRSARYVVTAPLPPGIGAGLTGALASFALDYLPD